MGQIRPLVEEDLPAVIDLHHRVFGTLKNRPPEAVRSFYTDIFFRYPWRDSSITSLVYQEDDGRIMGCLGSLRRPMRMKGKVIQMAISNNFMVDPASRSTLAGVQLLRTFFAGPQDLSLAEGNSFSRKVWEGLGGCVAYPYSMIWTFPLQPSRYVISALRKRGLSAVLASALRPVSGILDIALSRIGPSPFRLAVPQLSGTSLDVKGILDHLPTFTSDYELQPVYDGASLEWLLDLVSRRQGFGDLRMRAVDGGQKGVVGWYVYYLKRGGTAQVLQIVAYPSSREEVLSHLLDDARREGALAVSGQVEPRWLAPLSQRSCLFTQIGSWILVHARDPALVHVFQRGDAFLSRLEGEWCIGV
jgi:hypothetical protein